MICIKIFVEEVWVFLIFVDFCISCFEVTLVGDFMSFGNFLFWVLDDFIWMVHEILHAMIDSKEIRFCWYIHVSTEAHGEILKIIVSLDSDVHESTNLVIEKSPMWFLDFFQLFSNERCLHKYYLFKRYIHWKRWLLESYLIFYLCSSIFSNIIFHDIICLVNTGYNLFLDNINIEEI